MAFSEFSEMMSRERITVSGIPASYWHEWVRAMNDESDVPPDLRLAHQFDGKSGPEFARKMDPADAWPHHLAERLRSGRSRHRLEYFSRR